MGRAACGIVRSQRGTPGRKGIVIELQQSWRAASVRPVIRAIAVASVALVGATVAVPAAGAEVEGLSEARAAAQAATQQLSDAEGRLGALELEISRTEHEAEAAEAELEELRAQLQAYAVGQYTTLGDVPSITDEDPNRQARANAMARFVTQGNADVVDEYRATRDDLDAASEELDELRAEQEQVIEDLSAQREALEAELARLEELERARIAEERRKAEAAARAEEAARLARQQEADDAGSGGGNTPSGPIASGPWVCPVQGPRSFVNDYGDPRSGGRRHQGIDIMSPTGTPVVAPVSGTVTHRSVSLGGLSFYLSGSDGQTYFGTHLSAYGNAGSVAAGTVIGYVGSTGNASTPHLHFEISGQNPYGTLARYC